MGLKDLVLQYINTHEVNILLRKCILHNVWHSKTDEEIYMRMVQICGCVTLRNAKIRGYNNYIPSGIADELVCDDIKKILDKNKKE